MPVTIGFDDPSNYKGVLGDLGTSIYAATHGGGWGGLLNPGPTLAKANRDQMVGVVRDALNATSPTLQRAMQAMKDQDFDNAQNLLREAADIYQGQYGLAPKDTNLPFFETMLMRARAKAGGPVGTPEAAQNMLNIAGSIEDVTNINKLGSDILQGKSVIQANEAQALSSKEHAGVFKETAESERLLRPKRLEEIGGRITELGTRSGANVAQAEAARAQAKENLARAGKTLSEQDIVKEELRILKEKGYLPATATMNLTPTTPRGGQPHRTEMPLGINPQGLPVFRDVDDNGNPLGPDHPKMVSDEERQDNLFALEDDPSLAYVPRSTSPGEQYGPPAPPTQPQAPTGTASGATPPTAARPAAAPEPPAPTTARPAAAAPMTPRLTPQQIDSLDEGGLTQAMAAIRQDVADNPGNYSPAQETALEQIVTEINADLERGVSERVARMKAFRKALYILTQGQQ